MSSTEPRFANKMYVCMYVRILVDGIKIHLASNV